MFTHLTTNPPISCLNRAERTGSLVVSATIDPVSLKLAVSGEKKTSKWTLLAVRREPGFSYPLSVRRTSANSGCDRAFVQIFNDPQTKSCLKSAPRVFARTSLRRVL